MANEENLIHGGHLKHGAWKFLRLKELPEEHRDLAPVLDEYTDALIDQCGGENVEPIQAALIGIAREMHGARRLVGRYIAQSGPVVIRQRKKKGKPTGDAPTIETQPAMRSWAAFANAETRALKALQDTLPENEEKGKAIDLAEYLKRREASKESGKK